MKPDSNDAISDEQWAEIHEWLAEGETQGAISYLITPDGSKFALGGAHSQDAWCWCQPSVTYRHCAAHWEHAVVMHRRSFDESEQQEADRCNSGWKINAAGSAWPKRNWPNPAEVLDSDAKDA